MLVTKVDPRAVRVNIFQYPKESERDNWDINWDINNGQTKEKSTWSKNTNYESKPREARGWVWRLSRRFEDLEHVEWQVITCKSDNQFIDQAVEEWRV